MQNPLSIDQAVLHYVNHTRRHVFLTGKAGTGKTTLLREIVSLTHKPTVVVAPTGVAALNAGGVTIHSFFQLPPTTFLPEESARPAAVGFETPASLKRHFNFGRDKKLILQRMELLIIDEVSMLRPDLLDAIDEALRHVRKCPKPFGDVQVLFIGDLLQLPPVIKDQEWELLKEFYSGKYFFNSRVFRRAAPVYAALSKIHRQSDIQFITALNRLRDNGLTSNDVAYLNRYYVPGFSITNHPGYIVLTSLNARADAINQEALRNLKGQSYHFEAVISGNFPSHIYPTDLQLTLKFGAQVMFIKNDVSPTKKYYNGKIGIISAIDETRIRVYFPDEGSHVDVNKFTWEHIKYTADESGNILEEVLGTFSQYPLRLAYAITIHKSQGLTFEKAAIDLARVFMHGQAYVALSRLRTPEGLVLISPMRQSGLDADPDVLEFTHVNEAIDIQTDLPKGVEEYWQTLVDETLQFNNLVQDCTKQLRMVEIRTEGRRQQVADLKAKFDRLQILAEDVDLSALRAGSFSEQCLTVNSLCEFYFSIVDELVSELFVQLSIAGTSAKNKAWITRLKEIEGITSAKAIALFRLRNMARAYRDGNELTCKTIDTAFIKSYRNQKRSEIRPPERIKKEIEN